MIYNIIPLTAVKCQDCNEFNAGHQIVTAVINKGGKDKVNYKMLCRDCAIHEVLILECEALENGN